MLSLSRVHAIARCCTLLLVVASESSITPALHAEEPAHQKLVIATRTYLPPYVEAGAESGIEIDLIKKIFEGTAYQPVFHQQPRVRMIAAFDRGHVDGILTQNIAASTAGCATNWYIAHENIAVSLLPRQLEFRGLEGLQGQSVLSFSGATRYLGPSFEKAVGQASRYTESGDQGAHIKLLYSGRFDLVAGDRWILQLAQVRHHEQTGEFKSLKVHEILPPSRYVARFQRQDICDAFNLSLARLRESGGYAQIWNRYIEKMEIAQSPQLARH